MSCSTVFGIPLMHWLTAEPSACLEVYCRPDKNIFSFGKSKKNWQGAKSGEYDVCGKVWCLIVSIPDLCPLSYFRNCFTISDVCLCLDIIMQ